MDTNKNFSTEKTFLEITHVGCFSLPEETGEVIWFENNLMLPDVLTNAATVSVRKLDLSQLCFSLNFYFLMLLLQFPSMFPLLNYSQSFLFLICQSPETLKTKEKPDFDSTDTGTV